jgi:geranylgeranyl transferase type-2 subunit alpha
MVYSKSCPPSWRNEADRRNPEGIRTLCLEELQFLFLRLREYPKCYWIWLYRKTVLDVCPDADWETELKLDSKVLEADARNCPSLTPQALPPFPVYKLLTGFLVHGWEYRRYVVVNIERARGSSLSESEFEFTTNKTNNISNFSAWHNRANLIPTLLPPRTDPKFEDERKAFLTKGPFSYFHFGD